MPFTTVQKGSPAHSGWMIFLLRPLARLDDGRPQITGLLRERHHLTAAEDDDFNVRKPEDLIQAQLATSRIITLLLASVASLSLLIGGIGIMNIMLVSVTRGPVRSSPPRRGSN
jgi:putative ABC transport system permease protein